jgi:hypothetical protein
MTRRHQIFLLLIVFTRTISIGQIYCGDKNEKADFPRIFGADRLLVYGEDTIITDIKEKLIYSCDQCSIICVDNNGSKKWTTDLSEYKCRLISFKTFYKLTSKKEKKYKGCDIILQFSDKKIYGLKSKTGKIKYIKKLNTADT